MDETADPQELTALANQWFAAFNAHDVQALVALYDEEAVHHSPKLKVRKPETSGIIRGKEALAQWWQDAFDKIEGLRYEISHIMTGKDHVAVVYTRHAEGAPDMEVAEVYQVKRIREDLRIVVSKVYHGD